MSFNGTRKLTERSIIGLMLGELGNGLGTSWFSEIVARIQSNQPDGENAGWLGGSPKMTEQKGDKLQANLQFIRNIPFQAGILVPKNDWLFEKWGSIERAVMRMSEQAVNHPGELILSAILNGTSTACYDGQYYYDTDHLEGSSGTQSNSITYAKAAAAPTVAEVKGAITAAIAALWAFKDDKGNYVNLNATKFQIGAGAALMPTVLETLGITTYVGGATGILNANNQAFQLVPQILPGQTANTLTVTRMRGADKGEAFILQTLMPTAPVVLGIDSEYCKQNGNLLFKVEGTYNVGYGRWQDSVLQTFTGP